jgi:hypothetical protein
MSLTLRSRAAGFILVAIFLIPVSMTSLRGLTHILSCTEQGATPFTMEIVRGSSPVITTSLKQAAGQDQGLCGGLLLDMRAKMASPEAVQMILLINNRTDALWVGTIQLDMARGAGKLQLPLNVGRIAAGETNTTTVSLRLDPGQTHLSGSILIGP